MPLDLRNQPPYYEIGSFQHSGLRNLYSQTTAENSSGTSVTDVGLCTIPANTLDENGTVLEITYWGHSYNNPTNFNIYLNIS